MPVFLISSVAFWVVCLSDVDQLETVVELWFYLAIYFKFNSLLSILDERLYLVLVFDLIIASVIFQNWLVYLKLHKPLFSEHGSVYFANSRPPPEKYNKAYCKVNIAKKISYIL